MQASEFIAVKVWRGNADGGRFADYEVPHRPAQTILDVVTWIQRHADPGLAYRFACRVGMCGSCAMMVNGSPRWTCRTHVNKVIDGNRLTIEPLRNLPVIKDLACDMSAFFDKWNRAEGRFVGTATREQPVAAISPREPARPGQLAVRLSRAGRVEPGLEPAERFPRPQSRRTSARGDRRRRLSPVSFAAGVRDALPQRTQPDSLDRRSQAHGGGGFFRSRPAAR